MHVRQVVLAVGLVALGCGGGTGTLDGGSGGGSPGGGSAAGGGAGGAAAGGSAAGGSAAGGSAAGGSAAGGSSAGGSAAGGGGTWDGGLPSPSEICPLFVRQLCDRQLRCGLMSATELDLCRQDAADRCGRLAHEVDAGISAWDLARVQQCLLRFDTYSCQAFESIPSACLSVLTPSSGLGGACLDTRNCTAGYCAGAGSGPACTACVPYAALGANCRLVQCDPATSWCSPSFDGGQPFCEAAYPANAPCLYSEMCGSGSSCDRTTRRCTPFGALGTTCTNGGPGTPTTCQRGLDCFGGRCVPRPDHSQDAGAECVRRFDCTTGSCVGAVPTTFLADGGTMPGSTGTCGPWAAVGMACGAAQPCQAGLGCVSGSCVPLSAVGGACTTRAGCSAWLQCTGGLCARAPGVCLEGPRCVSPVGAPGQCNGEDGGCLAPAPAGAACSEDFHCSSSRCVLPDGGWAQSEPGTCAPPCL